MLILLPLGGVRSKPRRWRPSPRSSRCGCAFVRMVRALRFALRDRLAVLKGRRPRLIACRGSSAKPAPPSHSLRSGLLRQLLPTVTVAAQIVHFPPKLVSIRVHLGEALAQSQHLGLQRRGLKRQFVSCVSRRFRCAVPIIRDAAGAASYGCLRRRGPS
jgi:hypothetical protein